jgi:hypothetical protein
MRRPNRERFCFRSDYFSSDGPVSRYAQQASRGREAGKHRRHRDVPSYELKHLQAMAEQIEVVRVPDSADQARGRDGQARCFPAATRRAPCGPNRAPASAPPRRAAPGEPCRQRNKAHLRFVASQPCLACGRKPADAHHLRFAQPRALGRKVSDEFTVPLCRAHRREIHGSGDERGWWTNAGIEPVEVARKLWNKTLTTRFLPTANARVAPRGKMLVTPSKWPGTGKQRSFSCVARAGSGSHVARLYQRGGLPATSNRFLLR